MRFGARIAAISPPRGYIIISDADARLACLDDEISTLEEKLQQLEEERASLSHYWTRNKVILSPLRRMPSEVLGEIFLLTLRSVMADLGPKDYLVGSPWMGVAAHQQPLKSNLSRDSFAVVEDSHHL
jgi:hypothetical protein